MWEHVEGRKYSRNVIYYELWVFKDGSGCSSRQCPQYMYMYVMYITTLRLHLSTCASLCTSGRSPETNQSWHKKVPFLCKVEVWHYISWLTDKASNSTDSRLNQAFRSVRDKMEIDKCAHRWQPGGDERATLGIRDCPLCFVEGDYFVVCVLCMEFLQLTLLDE